GTNFNASVGIRLSFNIMQIFGNQNASFTLTSRVSNGAQTAVREITMVLDSSSAVNSANIRTSSVAFVTRLFNGAATLPNTYVSVVPYDVAVNVGTTPITRLTWAQNLLQYVALGGGGGNGFFANRNPDIPFNNTFVDISDAPPAIAATSRFRTPYGLSPGTFNNGDFVNRRVSRLLFASNRRTTINSAINAMRNAGRTRLNVGLMWGWFTLSERWQGRWDAGLPALPMSTNPSRRKYLVFLAGSRNNVYLGGTQPCGAGNCAVSNDNTTFAAMCETMKGQGIYIYTIGFGAASAYNASQLSTCSSGQGYFFTAANVSQLTTVFQGIVDSINFNTLRLAQ
ncbi:MAG: hypothetical protein K2Q01_08910, partial [Rickettsiales bacterium]|nr:hypothetical protein [Rickettsiales bacterium]